MLEPVAHLAELEKARAGAHPEAGAEQQRQPERPPHHAVDGVVHLCDDLDHTLVSPCTQKAKSGQNPPKALPAKFKCSHFSAAGVRRLPGRTHCAQKTMALSFCLRDTAAFPCGLTPSAPAALKRGLLQSARTLPAVHVFFSSSGAQLCAIERLYHILSLCARHFIYRMLLFHLLCRQMNFILV